MNMSISSFFSTSFNYINTLWGKRGARGRVTKNSHLIICGNRREVLGLFLWHILAPPTPLSSSNNSFLPPSHPPPPLLCASHPRYVSFFLTGRLHQKSPNRTWHSCVDRMQLVIWLILSFILSSSSFPPSFILSLLLLLFYLFMFFFIFPRLIICVANRIKLHTRIYSQS